MQSSYYNLLALRRSWSCVSVNAKEWCFRVCRQWGSSGALFATCSVNVNKLWLCWFGRFNSLVFGILWPLVALESNACSFSLQPQGICICVTLFCAPLACLLACRPPNSSHCEKRPLNGTIEPAFGWVEKATYAGKQEIRHHEFDLWSYHVSISVK